MLLVHPNGRYAGRVVESLVGTIDLMPTVLAWLGVDYRGQLDGRDLTPLLEGHRGEPREIYTEQLEYFPVRAIRTDDWLLVQRSRAGVPLSEGQLHLYARNRGEGGRLHTTDNPQVEQHLLRSLKSLAKSSTARDSREIEIAPEVLERLRALGYTDEVVEKLRHRDAEEQ